MGSKHFFNSWLVEVSFKRATNLHNKDHSGSLPRMASCTQKIHVMIPEFEDFRRDLRACFLVKAESDGKVDSQLDYKLPICNGLSPEYRMQNIINGAEKNPSSYKNFYVNWIRHSIFEDPEIIRNLLNAIILNAHCSEAVVHSKKGLSRPDGVTVFMCIVMSANEEMLDFFKQINLFKSAIKWVENRPMNATDILALSLFEKRTNPEIVEGYYPELLNLVDGWQSFCSVLRKNTEAFRAVWKTESPAWSELIDMPLLRGFRRKIGRKLDWQSQRESNFQNLLLPTELKFPVPMGFVWVCLEFIDRHIDDLLKFDADQSIPELRRLIDHYLGEEVKTSHRHDHATQRSESETETADFMGVLDAKSNFYGLATKRFGDYRDKIKHYEESSRKKKTSPKQENPFWGI